MTSGWRPPTDSSYCPAQLELNTCAWTSGHFLTRLQLPSLFQATNDFLYWALTARIPWTLDPESLLWPEYGAPLRFQCSLNATFHQHSLLLLLVKCWLWHPTNELLETPHCLNPCFSFVLIDSIKLPFYHDSSAHHPPWEANFKAEAESEAYQ